MKRELIIGLTLFSVASSTSIIKGGSKDNVSYRKANELHCPRNYADSSFRPNSAQGWDTLDTYFNKTGDSVLLEVILQCSTTSDKDWSQPSEFGTIGQNYQPGQVTLITYKDPLRTWEVTIYQDGRCFLRLLDGPIPDGQPATIPIVAQYKP